MRKPIIAGNWKMNKTIAEAISFVNDVKNRVENKNVDVVICAPFIALKDLVEATKGTNIKVGAQNMHFEESGAYTGEVSAQMLNEIGVDYVIIGHSERREYFNETNETVNKKVLKALKEGLLPGETKEHCKEQIQKALENVSASDLEKIVIAYEPIWAIGTGKTATSDDANDVIAYIRNVVRDLYGNLADNVRIQYGGSVKPSNISEIMAKSDIDGALVGGASLAPEDYVKLVNF